MLRFTGRLLAAVFVLAAIGVPASASASTTPGSVVRPMDCHPPRGYCCWSPDVGNVCNI